MPELAQEEAMVFVGIYAVAVAPLQIYPQLMPSHQLCGFVIRRLDFMA
jgi:hypothetical protein